MATSAMKGLASAAAGGLVPYICCSHAAMSAVIAVPAAVLGSIASLTWYARVFIQGYYFDKRCGIQADLTQKVAVVTGGTIGGLGYASAEILANMGATVVLTVRNERKGNEAIEALKQAAGHTRISYVVIDFLSKKSIRAGAASIIAAHSSLDMLILNAGVGGGATEDVWMSNQVGPFLFTDLLTPLLVKTARSSQDGVRVTAVSSGAHKGASINYVNPYKSAGEGTFAGAYGQSKLAQIMHMRELQRRLRAESGLGGEKAVRCISITPGFALTNIAAGKIPTPLMPFVWLISRSAHVGAQPIQMACVDPDVPGASYLSNCYVKATEGAGGCSNSPEEWVKLWDTCQKCIEDDRYP